MDQPNPCLNAGICRESGEDFSCRCQENFTGITCETGNLFSFSSFTSDQIKKKKKKKNIFTKLSIIPKHPL